jgi:hypothetical protein
MFSTRSVQGAYKGTQESGHGSRWGSTPRITMLANASSKLLLACLLGDSQLVSEWPLDSPPVKGGGGPVVVRPLLLLKRRPHFKTR